MDTIILGDGGEKPKSIRPWQKSPILKPIFEQIMSFSNDINSRLDTGELFWDGNELCEEENFNDND
jgi:hypothetical protein